MRYEARFRAYRQPMFFGTSIPYIDGESWGKIGADCHIFTVVAVKHRYWDQYALGLYEEFDVTLVAGRQVEGYMVIWTRIPKRQDFDIPL